LAGLSSVDGQTRADSLLRPRDARTWPPLATGADFETRPKAPAPGAGGPGLSGVHARGPADGPAARVRARPYADPDTGPAGRQPERLHALPAGRGARAGHR